MTLSAVGGTLRCGRAVASRSAVCRDTSPQEGSRPGVSAGAEFALQMWVRL